MTPEETREAAAVMLAHAEGKKIECRSKISSAAGWIPKLHTGWVFDEYEYRIAPEPWTGKIWVSDEHTALYRESHDADEWRGEGYRLITAKEVTDE